jgi:hypothetical protein
MGLFARANERLKWIRISLLAAMLALPDILSGLSGSDFNILAPNSGSKIGACVALARLKLIPVLMQPWRDTRGPDARGPH